MRLVTPSAELKKAQHWQLGNLSKFAEWTGSFAIGRTSIGNVPLFDKDTGQFREDAIRTNPFAYCVFDAELGLVAISRRHGIRAKSKTIASRLEALLQSTPTAQAYATVEVSPIPDPESFVKIIETAHRVLALSATFSGPNPVDADIYFQKPLALLLQRSRGKRGRARLTGPNLDPKFAADVARSAAATGNEVSARIMRNPGSPPESVEMEPQPAAFEENATDRVPTTNTVANLKARYEEISYHEGG